MSLLEAFLQGRINKNNPQLAQQRYQEEMNKKMASLAEPIYGSPAGGGRPGSGLFDESLPLDVRHQLMNKRMLESGLGGFIQQWAGNQQAMQNSNMQNIGAIKLAQEKDKMEKINGPKTTDQVTMANTYRDDYRKDAEPWQNSIDAFNRMREISKPDSKGNYNIATDNALIKLYARLLEPKGLLTDADVDQARADGTLNYQIQKYFNMLKDGTLPSDVRNHIMNAAGKLYNQSVNNLLDTQAFYSTAASQYGIPVKQLFTPKEYDMFEQIEFTPSSIGDTVKDFVTPVKDEAGKLIDSVTGKAAELAKKREEKNNPPMINNIPVVD